MAKNRNKDVDLASIRPGGHVDKVLAPKIEHVSILDMFNAVLASNNLPPLDDLSDSRRDLIGKLEHYAAIKAFDALGIVPQQTYGDKRPTTVDGLQYAVQGSYSHSTIHTIDREQATAVALGFDAALDAHFKAAIRAQSASKGRVV